MDADRFDAVTRFIGSRRSRRVALGLVMTGLLTVAVPDAEARCSARKPCPTCKRCRRHRCRRDTSQDGTVCDGDGGTCQNGTCVSFCAGKVDRFPCGTEKHCVGGACQSCQGPTDACPAGCAAGNTPCSGCCNGVCGCTGLCDGDLIAICI